MGSLRRSEEIIVLSIESDYVCLSPAAKIGNFIGDGAVVPLSCERKVCDCYIAFSNLNNLTSLHRIAEKGRSGEYLTSHLLRLFSSMWMEH